jgi:hypothetical protein
MRARDRDRPEGAGAAFGLEHGVVGIGDSPGPKGARMVERLADLPEGTFVWTRGPGGEYHLGRVAGPLRFDDSPAAREVGIHHVRAARWLDRAFGDREVPPAVAHTFARGGRNLQRTHDEEAEQETADLWEEHGS